MKRTVLFAAIAAMVLPGLFSCNGNDNENDSPSKIYTTPEYDLTSTSQKPVFILGGGIPSFLRWLAHGMSHLEATASPLTLVFVIILTPTRGRSRTTTATRFGHGCRCINHIKEEKHTYMRNVLSLCSHIRVRSLNLIEEDVLDRVRNIDSLHFTANIDIESRLSKNRKIQKFAYVLDTQHFICHFLSYPFQPILED